MLKTRALEEEKKSNGKKKILWGRIYFLALVGFNEDALYHAIRAAER